MPIVPKRKPRRGLDEILISAAVFVTGALLIGAILLGIDYGIYRVYNAVMPPVFHWPPMTYWQTVGLIILIGVVGNAVRSHVTSKADK